MKSLLICMSAATLLTAAQNPIYMAPPGAPTVAAKPTAAEKMAAAKEATQSKEATPKGPSDVMIISPDLRANDIKTAIEYLKQRSPTSKPKVELTNGTAITGILDVDVMPGGTILIFRVNSFKGMQYKVVKIEEINTLSNE